MAQISLREYLKRLFTGTKEYIDEGTESLNASIDGHGTALTTAVNNINTSIASLSSVHAADITRLDGEIDANEKSIQNNAAEIASLKTEVNSKLDAELVIPWATYDATGKVLQISAQGSSYTIK